MTVQKTDEMSPKELELQKKNEELMSKLKEEAMLREQVLQDEAIMQVLEARKTGQEIEVKPKAKVAPKPSLRDRLGRGSPEKPSATAVDEMTNTELVDIVIPAVEEMVKSSVAEARKEATGGAEERFKMLEGNQMKLHNALVKQAAAAGVTSMRAGYNDFDKYSEGSIKIMKETGLSIEDAYLLAKAREGSSVPERNQVETERPSAAPFGSPARQRPETQEGIPERRESATRKFRGLVETAAEKVLRQRNAID